MNAPNRPSDFDEFDPYYRWLGIQKSLRPPTYYQLLGVAATESDQRVIDAASKRHLRYVRQFRGTEHDAIAVRLIYEIELATLTLLSGQLRQEYDLTLKSKKIRQRVRGRGNRTAASRSSGAVGEGSEIVSSFAGVMGVIILGILIMAGASFYFPWQRMVFDVSTPDSDVNTNDASASNDLTGSLSSSGSVTAAGDESSNTVPDSAPQETPASPEPSSGENLPSENSVVQNTTEVSKEDSSATSNQSNSENSPQSESNVPSQESKSQFLSSSEIEVARQILQYGGKVTVRFQAGGQTGEYQQLLSETDIASNRDSGPAVISGVDLKDRRIPLSFLENGISTLTDLEDLTLMGTGVPDDALRLIQTCTSLRSLNIAGTAIHGSGFQYLTQLRDLETILCGGSPIEDQHLHHLTKIRDLKTLGLIATWITDKGAATLSQLTSLQILRLAETKISDRGLGHLVRLTGLKQISLSKSRVTRRGAARFKSMVPGCDVQF